MGPIIQAQEISIMLLSIQFFILRTLSLFLILGAIASCSRYAVTVNDNLVYAPAGLFSQYTIADPALKECVRETIAEDGLTKAEQLTRLICPPGEIHNLHGLSVFSQLRHLGLASNEIVDITPLSALIELRQVDLHDNSIQNLAPLALLPHLEHINIRGNSRADCSSIRLDQASLHTQKLPEHCY